MKRQAKQTARVLAVLALALGFVLCINATASDQPDASVIEKKSLEILSSHLPHPDKSGEITLPDQTKVTYGPLFDEGMVALLNFYPRPVNDEVFDYPPCFLSLARYSDNAWRYLQYLGSTSQYKIYERKDLRLKIVIGSRQTARNEGEFTSWKWDSFSHKLVPTGLDNWGPYSIIGDFIVYRRGIERLAHWDTHWIYRFEKGKRCEFVACYHEADSGRWTISFHQNKDDKEFSHWSFQPDLDHPESVTVRAVADEEDFDGSKIAQLTIAKGEELEQGFCFELLTGLSSILLKEDWAEKVPQPTLKNRQKIEAEGEPAVVSRFQWPPKN